jgi:hypothetical protein
MAGGMPCPHQDATIDRANSASVPRPPEAGSRKFKRAIIFF